MPKRNSDLFDKEREEANFALLHALTALVHRYPTMRFGQLLMCYGFLEYKTIIDETIVRDPFNEEPQRTLERVKKEIERTI